MGGREFRIFLLYCLELELQYSYFHIMRGGPKQPYEESLGPSGDLISSWLFPADVFIQSTFPEGPPQPCRVYSADKDRMTFSQNPGVGETALKRVIITHRGGWMVRVCRGITGTQMLCLGRRGSWGGDA